MKQYLVLILIAFHLFSSSAYATKSFIDKDHFHNDFHKCSIHEHQHQHFHNGSNHQHKHSHSQVNINYVDFFTDTHNINLYDLTNLRQTYLETASWVDRKSVV